MMLCVLLLTLVQVLPCRSHPEAIHRYSHNEDVAYYNRGDLSSIARQESSALHSAIPLATRRASKFALQDRHRGRLAGRAIGCKAENVSQQVLTTTVSSGVVQIVSNACAGRGDTTGTIVTSVEKGGRYTEQPLLTDVIDRPTSLLSPTPSVTAQSVTSSTVTSSSGTAPPVTWSNVTSSSGTAPTVTWSNITSSSGAALSGAAQPVPPENKVDMAPTNIFAEPIATTQPPADITRQQNHPVPRLGIVGVPPFQTNKFYANKFLGSQSSPSYLHPYSVAWAQGKGASASWGLAISHIEASQRVYGPPTATTGAASYFINPVGIQSLCISAKELGSSTALTTDLLTDTSVRVSLRPSAQSSPAVQFPLVQGAAFVTAVFNGATPMIQSGVFYKTVTKATTQVKPGVTKYKFVLEDGHTWLLYAYCTKGSALDLQVSSNSLAQASGPFYGIIQIAKDPGNGEAIYDKGCGVYPTGFTVSGSANGAQGTYSFTWNKAGMTTTPLIMFALPHHAESFDPTTQAAMSQLQLQTTTKGMATAVVADFWTMIEPEMPVDMSFTPWSATLGSVTTLSADAKAYIQNIATQEISQNIQEQTNQSSVYFSGKALAKFAAILIVINDLLGNKALAQTGLNQLKVAFALFASNKQQYPLFYDEAWRGVVSSASYTTGDSGADFGNTYYNDHHFHYGYFIYTAAVIGHLDPTWIPANKDYVNMLVRDVANPCASDKFFPVSRMFDWYHGHSWAHGLFETLDGKDQESSSEDANHLYAIKMWGTVVGDQNMAARGNLQLSILARALQHYYLYQTNNTVEPSNYVGNRAAGILFENKIDHTTYFGTNIEYIEGIHMLPLMPSTQLTRAPAFVSEEWSTYFSNNRANNVAGGWKGILFGNYATIDPKGAYTFFSSPTFDPSWLDGGASLTWYLAYAAAMGGA